MTHHEIKLNSVFLFCMLVIHLPQIFFYQENVLDNLASKQPRKTFDIFGIPLTTKLDIVLLACISSSNDIKIFLFCFIFVEDI